jgi:PST family polysaccharide transporter
MSWQMWRSLSAYGRPVVLSSLLREIGFSGTTAFVGRALGTAELGRFRAAQRFVQQANAVVVTGTAYALLPALARIAADEARLRAAVLRTIRVVTLLVVPVSLVFIPLGSQFAVVLLGARWRGAGPIMMAMAGMGIALALDSISSEAFKATGRTDLLPRMHGLTAVVPLAFMFALFRLGGAGMGLAMTIGTSIVAAYAIRALGRVAAIPLQTILRQTRSAATAGVVMLVAVLLLDRLLIHADGRSGAAGVGTLVGEVVIAAVVYLAALALVSRRELMELMELVRLLLRRAG